MKKFNFIVKEGTEVTSSYISKSLQPYELDLNTLKPKDFYNHLRGFLIEYEYFAGIVQRFAKKENYKNDFIFSEVNFMFKFTIKQILSYITVQNLKNCNINKEYGKFLKKEELKKLINSFSEINDRLYWSNYQIKVDYSFLKGCELYSYDVVLYYEDLKAEKIFPIVKAYKTDIFISYEEDAFFNFFRAVTEILED